MNWYCIYTRPAKEGQVESYLNTRLGLTTYAPRIIEEKLVRGQMTEVAGPLFPRYVFCRLDSANGCQSVRGIPEVIDLVRCGDEPAIAADSLVAQLKSWAGEGVDVLNFQPGSQAGSSVEVTCGQQLRLLSDTIVKSANAKERVALLLTILTKANSIREAGGIEKNYVIN